MDVRLTSQDVWLSTLLFGGLSFIAFASLLFVTPEPGFKIAVWPIGIAAALFWGALAIFAVFSFWDLYYRHFYPTWMRWLTPLDVLLYSAIGLGLWVLAVRVGRQPVLAFVLLGGVEGIAEHLFGIYILRILDRVPLLQGLDPLPVLVFSFFEYVLYWALVAWLALGLFKFS
jgi:hypothetical protein